MAIKKITMKTWKNTHKDYKGLVNGKRYMVVLNRKTQGTEYVPVEIITKKVKK